MSPFGAKNAGKCEKHDDYILSTSDAPRNCTMYLGISMPYTGVRQVPLQ